MHVHFRHMHLLKCIYMANLLCSLVHQSSTVDHCSPVISCWQLTTTTSTTTTINVMNLQHYQDCS